MFLSESSTTATTRWYWLASLCVLFGTTVIRYFFVRSGQLNLAPDEAQYWDWSRSLQWSYYSKGPLIAMINRFGTALLGNTECGVRLGALLGGFLMQALVLVWLGRLLGRIRLAFWTLFVLNTTPLFMAGALLMTTDNPLLLCWFSAFLCLFLAFEKPEKGVFLCLGGSLALGILAKYTMLFFVPLTLLTCWLVQRKEVFPAIFWRRLGKSLGSGAVAGLIPVLLWNMGNDWVGLKHVLYRGALAGEKAQTLFRWKYFPEYLGGQFGVLTPWWLLFMLCAGFFVLRALWRGGPYPFGLSRRLSVLLSMFFWPVWLLFLFWSLHAKVEANWSAAAYPAGFLLAGLLVEEWMWKKPWTRWQKALPVAATVVFTVVHLQGFLPFDGPKNPVHRLRGWADLGNHVANILHTELGGPEVAFAFSDEYSVTSELSFYVPGQKRAFCCPGQRKVNQYDLWPGPGPEYENAVLVCRGKCTSVPRVVHESFRDISAPQVFESTHKGCCGQLFTLFICRGFEGGWPAQEMAKF